MWTDRCKIFYELYKRTEPTDRTELLEKNNATNKRKKLTQEPLNIRIPAWKKRQEEKKKATKPSTKLLTTKYKQSKNNKKSQNKKEPDKTN